MKLDDSSRVVGAYFIFAMALGVVIPTAASALLFPGIPDDAIPLFRWFRTYPDIVPMARGYFVAMWLLMPVWLVVFGRTYWKYYSSRGVNVPLLVVLAIFYLSCVAWFAWMGAPWHGHGAWRTMLVAHAMTHRLGAAFVFGGFLMVVYAILAFALVKTPIDVIRRITGDH
jgi:hypothetical protein